MCDGIVEFLPLIYFALGVKMSMVGGTLVYKTLSLYGPGEEGRGIRFCELIVGFCMCYKIIYLSLEGTF